MQIWQLEDMASPLKSPLPFEKKVIRKKPSRDNNPYYGKIFYWGTHEN